MREGTVREGGSVREGGCVREGSVPEGSVRPLERAGPGGATTTSRFSSRLSSSSYSSPTTASMKRVARCADARFGLPIFTRKLWRQPSAGALNAPRGRGR